MDVGPGERKRERESVNTKCRNCCNAAAATAAAKTPNFYDFSMDGFIWFRIRYIPFQRRFAFLYFVLIVFLAFNQTRFVSKENAS